MQLLDQPSFLFASRFSRGWKKQIWSSASPLWSWHYSVLHWSQRKQAKLMYLDVEIHANCLLLRFIIIIFFFYWAAAAAAVDVCCRALLTLLHSCMHSCIHSVTTIWVSIITRFCTFIVQSGISRGSLCNPTHCRGQDIGWVHRGAGLSGSPADVKLILEFWRRLLLQ